MELSIIILLDYLFAYKVVYLFQSLRKWDICGSVINSFKRGFFLKNCVSLTQVEIDYRTIYLGNIASQCVLKTNDSEKKLKISGSEFRHNDQKTLQHS